MNSSLKIFFKILSIGVLVVLVSTFFIFKITPEIEFVAQEKSIREFVLSELSVELAKVKKIKSKRKLANAEENEFVSVLLNKKQYQVLQFSEKITDDNFESLITFFKKQKFIKQNFDTEKLHFKLVSRLQVKDQQFIRFQQLVSKQIGPLSYKTPLKQAYVQFVLNSGKLVKVRAHVVKPSEIKSIYQKSGIQFDLSDVEFTQFSNALEKSKMGKTKILRSLKSIYSDKLPELNLESFFEMNVAEQQKILNKYFSSLGKLAVTSLFLDWVKENQLSYVNYGAGWKIEVRTPFDLPIEFDVENLNSNDGVYLKIKNLRKGQHRLSRVRAYESPYYPEEKGEESSEKIKQTKIKLEQIVNFYSGTYNWSNYQNKKDRETLEIHTQVEEYSGTAAWETYDEVLVTGADDEAIQILDQSYSVLAHEFTHAVLQFSSGLAYQKESGAINEHFADFQGAFAEMDILQKQNFPYYLGENTLTPQAEFEQIRFVNRGIQDQKFTKEEVEIYNLDKAVLKSFYAPSFSIDEQYGHTSKIPAELRGACEPSYENYNCGVHAQAGVLNRALSYVVGALSGDKARSLIFNTVVYRLNPDANFQDYLSELYRGCRSTLLEPSQCDVILASFAKVGIYHPDPRLDLSKIQ